jgi:Ulp1 family protease
MAVIDMKVHTTFTCFFHLLTHTSQTSHIFYHDSLGSQNPVVLQNLMQYLQDRAPPNTFDATRWTCVNSMRTIPQQENFSDCGVFSLVLTLFAADNQPFTYSQTDMQYYRNFIALAIYKRDL